MNTLNLRLMIIISTLYTKYQKHLILKKILSNISTFLKVLNIAMRFFIKKIINLLMTQKQPALSTKKALESNKNIYWILGGLPKERDNFNLSNVKKILQKLI